MQLKSHIFFTTLLTIFCWMGGSQFQNAYAQPNAVCQNYTAYLTPNGVAVITPSNVDGGTTGATQLAISVNGSGPTSAHTFSCTDVGQTFQVSLIATDGNGVSNACTALVDVRDITAPAASCQNITVTISSSAGVNVPATMIDGGSSDICGISSLTINGQANYTYTCNDVGTNIATLVVTDNSGNVDSCSATVTVQANSTICNGGGTNNYQLFMNNSGTTSNCNTCDGTTTFVGLYDPVSGNQAPGPYTFIWNDGVTTSNRNDLCANQAYTLTVYDAMQNAYTYTAFLNCSGTGTGTPNAVCNAYTYQLTPNGVATVWTQDIGGSSTGGQVYLMDGNNFVNSIQLNCSHMPSTSVTVAVVDSSGNVDTCSAMVYLSDPSGACGSTANPVANCVSNLNIDLGSSNNNAVVTPQMLDNGSTNATSMWIQYNGGVYSAYTFSCNTLGTHQMTLVVANSNNPAGTAGAYDSCMVVVTVTDTSNVCGGNTTYNIVDSSLVDASCNGVCDGSYTFGYVVLSNGNTAPAPYTIIWNDGYVGASRNNLCGNTTYTLTIYDAMQNSYSHTVAIGCSTTGGGGNPTSCIDSAQINLNTACPTVYQPVCGCDGVTYNNSCEAQSWYGVTSWTSGPCNSGGNGGFTVTTTGSSCDTSNCTGSATLVLNNGGFISNLSVSWSDGFTQSVNGPTIFRDTMCSGTYIANIVDNTGYQYTVTVVIGTAQGCVWPGDADDNTTVNNWDLLPIILTHGESGPTRNNATIGWYGQDATDWNTTNPIAGLPNYKHIDCNGDGIINQNDLQAIIQNYGQTYFRNGGNGLAGTTPFYVQSATVNEGDRISLPIMFGSVNDIATDVYGLAFTISYDTEMVDMGSVEVDFANSWLGNSLLDVQYDFSQQGQIEVAVGRLDRLNISGFGEIGKLNLTIRDDILRTTSTRSMDVTISNIRIIRNDNVELGSDPQVGTVTVNLNTNVEELNADYVLNVFPNPAQDQLTVRTDNAELQNVSLYNAQGQLVRYIDNIAGNQLQLEVADLATGVYALQIGTNKGTQSKRIVIQH